MRMGHSNDELPAAKAIEAQRSGHGTELASNVSIPLK